MIEGLLVGALLMALLGVAYSQEKFSIAPTTISRAAFERLPLRDGSAGVAAIILPSDTPARCLQHFGAETGIERLAGIAAGSLHGAKFVRSDVPLSELGAFVEANVDHVLWIDSAALPDTPLFRRRSMIVPEYPPIGANSFYVGAEDEDHKIIFTLDVVPALRGLIRDIESERCGVNELVRRVSALPERFRLPRVSLVVFVLPRY